MITENDIGAVGAKAMAQALERNTSLRTLDLGGMNDPDIATDDYRE